MTNPEAANARASGGGPESGLHAIARVLDAMQARQPWRLTVAEMEAARRELARIAAEDGAGLGERGA